VSAFAAALPAPPTEAALTDQMDQRRTNKAEDRALRDTKLTDADLSGKVEYLGSSVLSGGLIMDASGTLYGGDLEHRTVVALTQMPKQADFKGLRQRPLKTFLGRWLCDQRWLPLHRRFPSLGSGVQE
jgi:hypothetical protein